MSRWTWNGLARSQSHRVPEGYLRAEIASFPLTSEFAFRRSMTVLDPRMRDDGRTRGLWCECEELLAPHTGSTLERLVNARDQAWFGDPRQDQPYFMHEYLARLARSRLMARDGVTHVEQSTDVTGLDAATDYRWLTFALPEDLLLSGLDVDTPPQRVDCEPPLLIRRLLDDGVAEIHQHVGAGMGFRLLWVSVLAQLASPGVHGNELASPGVSFDNGRMLTRWLMVAAITRYVMAEFLNQDDEDSLGRYLQEMLARPIWAARRGEVLYGAFDAITSGSDDRLPEFDSLRDLYAEIHPTARLLIRDHPVRDVDDAYRRCDPIAVRLNLRGDNCGERWYVENGLNYLRRGRFGERRLNSSVRTREPCDDPLFARVFWQTIRLRCHYYRTVVERPMTGGLQWFIRFYNRLGCFRDPLYPIFPEASFVTAAGGAPIRSLEVRTHPDHTAVQIAENALTYLRSWQRGILPRSGSGTPPEFGLVLHFVKERHERHASSGRDAAVPQAFGAGSLADPTWRDSFDGAPGSYSDYARFSSYFCRQCRPARALAELMAAVPECLWFIRGLDVANDELGVPTWVLAPIMRYLLDESARHSIRNGAGPPLRVTGHVGEDFRHLLEGLRRIYEHVHYVSGTYSGRLGHALALGVDPRSWADATGSMLMPAEERLWDLVWEWRMHTQYRVKPEFASVAPPGRIEVLVNQVRRLVELIYAENLGVSIERLAEAHHWLHRFAVPPFHRRVPINGEADLFITAARNLGASHDGNVNWAADVSRILEHYLTNEKVFHNGQTLVDVRIDGGEVEALEAIQNAMRYGVAQNGIVVEINPSSNLLIGDLSDLRNHPVLRLSPPVPDDSGPPPIAIAIGSDDPVTFNTHLTREYTVMHETARAAGYSERDVQAWLETIRRTGMDARFTVPWKRDTFDIVVRSLERFLDLHPA